MTPTTKDSRLPGLLRRYTMYTIAVVGYDHRKRGTECAFGLAWLGQPEMGLLTYETVSRDVLIRGYIILIKNSLEIARQTGKSKHDKETAAESIVGDVQEGVDIAADLMSEITDVGVDAATFMVSEITGTVGSAADRTTESLTACSLPDLGGCDAPGLGSYAGPDLSGCDIPAVDCGGC